MAELVKSLTTPAITGPRSLRPELEAIKEIALEDHEMAMAVEYVKPCDDIDEYLPYFPSRVYDILPAPLKDIAEHFAGQPAERDVLTLSLITATSAILSHVRIHYDNHTYGPQGYTLHS